MAISGVGNNLPAAATSATTQAVEDIEKIGKKEVATANPKSVAINPPPQVDAPEQTEAAGDVNAFLKSLESSLADIEKSAKDAGSKIKMVAHFIKELLTKVPEDVKNLIKEGNISEELHAAFNDNKNISQLASKENKSINSLLN